LPLPSRSGCAEVFTPSLQKGFRVLAQLGIVV